MMNVIPPIDPQGKLREVNIFSFEPEVYDFVYSTLKKHEVKIWEMGIVVVDELKRIGAIPTDRLLVESLNFFQDGPMNNKMTIGEIVSLFQLALIYSGHYEIIENRYTSPETKKNLYYIIPNFLRQGRFNQPLKDVTKSLATSWNGMEIIQYENRLGDPKYENIVDRIDQDIDQQVKLLFNVIDNPPSNKNILGPNYVLPDDIIADMMTMDFWRFRTYIYEDENDRLLDVNRINGRFFAGYLMEKIYTTHNMVMTTALYRSLLLEDNNLLSAVWWAILDSIGLYHVRIGEKIKIPPNIYEQRRRKVHILSQLLEVGAAYVTPNIVSEFLEADDDTARKILTTFSAKRTTE